MVPEISLASIPSLKREELDPSLAVAGFIDVETTGLDSTTAGIVELGLVLVAFDRDSGMIVGRLDEYGSLHDPGIHIDSAASRINGITDELVKGHRIDATRVSELLSQCSVLVAHNAPFDRQFMAKMFPQTIRMRWVCTMRNINWAARGHQSRRLQDLLTAHGIQPEAAHRSLADTYALVRLMSLRYKDVPNMKRLMQSTGASRQLKERPLTDLERSANQEILRVLGPSRDVGFRANQNNVILGLENGTYPFARLKWGPRAKYLVLTYSRYGQPAEAPKQADERIDFGSLSEIASASDRIVRAYSGAVAWRTEVRRLDEKYGRDQLEKNAWASTRARLQHEVAGNEQHHVSPDLSPVSAGSPRTGKQEKNRGRASKPGGSMGCATIVVSFVLVLAAILAFAG